MPPKIQGFTQENVAQLRKDLLALKSAHVVRPWESLPPGKGGARPKQLPPDHPRHHFGWKNPRDGKVYRCSDYNEHCTRTFPDWTVWLFLAGRGAGKTAAGAQWAITTALSEPHVKVGVCAPTYSAVYQHCFAGDSGIVEQLLPGELASFNKNDLTIILHNGSVIQGYTAEQEKGIRGSNLFACWFDELAYMPDPHFYSHGLEPALRKPYNGKEPRLFVTTTPLVGMKVLRGLLDRAEKDPEHVHLTRAATRENIILSKRWLDDLHTRYKGTVLEKQELEGEMIDDIDGALFRSQDIYENRVDPRDVPELREGSGQEFRRIVVAIDPATSSLESSDETGIIVAAEAAGHHYYTLADYSLRANPSTCMNVAAGAYHEWGADIIVGESQVVGDYMKEALAQIDPNIFFKKVPAMKSKLIRAQPVANVMMQGRIHMVGMFEQLEEQLLGMTPDSNRSLAHDDRADAWVWALTELIGQKGANYLEVYGFEDCPKCQGRINRKLEKVCRHCGEIIAQKPAPTGRDRATRWSSAYMAYCANGHEYPMSLKSCPECKDDPNVQIAAALSFSGASAGKWLKYSGGNPLRGRT